MTGQLDGIFIAPRKRDPVIAVPSAVVIAGTGLQGDRYGSADSPNGGRHVTLIEAEEIERFNSEYHRAVTADLTRRNLVTRGIRLVTLVGHVFRVRGVLLRGIELCEPCLLLGRNLADSTMEPKDVVRAWVHRAGLCAEALDGGTIAVGDPICVVDPSAVSRSN